MWLSQSLHRDGLIELISFATGKFNYSFDSRIKLFPELDDQPLTTKHLPRLATAYQVGIKLVDNDKLVEYYNDKAIQYITLKEVNGLFYIKVTVDNNNKIMF